MSNIDTITIGLFSPLNLDLTPMFNAFSTLGEVRIVTALQKGLWSIDLLVYPDGMGIIPTIGGLQHNGRSFLPSKPIHPHFLLFWEENSVERFVEERGIPILGIGDAAAMLYDTLGGNIIIDVQGKPQLLANSNSEVIVHDKDRDYTVSAFSKDSVFGAMSIGAAINLIPEIKRHILHLRAMPDKNEGDNDDLTPIPTPYLPRILGGQK